jgi:hypothetical protein
MPLKYHSGEEISEGDHILHGPSRGAVEFIADPTIEDPKTKWYVEEYAGGIMLMTELYGRVFTANPGEDDELQFVRRAETESVAGLNHHDDK